MKKFDFKPLAISGIAIASVLILFKIVTAYGENHLQANPLIQNHYHLILEKNLPNCKKNNTLVLNIQQSGIFLNASLFPVSDNADTKSKFFFKGILKNQQLQLSGKIDTSTLCQIPDIQNSSVAKTTIQMSQFNQDNIPGQLKIDKVPMILEFTALPQIDKKSNSLLNSH